MNKEQPRDWAEIIVGKLIDHWINIDLPLDFEKTIAKALRDAYANGQKEIMENLAPPFYSELGTTGYIQDRRGNLYERKR